MLVSLPLLCGPTKLNDGPIYYHLRDTRYSEVVTEACCFEEGILVLQSWGPIEWVNPWENVRIWKRLLVGMRSQFEPGNGMEMIQVVSQRSLTWPLTYFVILWTDPAMAFIIGHYFYEEVRH